MKIFMAIASNLILYAIDRFECLLVFFSDYNFYFCLKFVHQLHLYIYGKLMSLIAEYIISTLYVSMILHYIAVFMHM